MANKQAFQFWYEKESRDGGWGATPRLSCGPCKRLPESPPVTSLAQASGVVATLKLKWEQVPERGRNDTELSDSQSSQSENMLDKSKKSKRIFTNQLLVHAKTTKISPAPKGASGRSCYGHAPVIAQVILIVILHLSNLEPHQCIVVLHVTFRGHFQT